MKKFKAFYYIGASLSMLVGIWHFFVPWMFQWSTYIPGEYELLLVLINWVNLCFSFFLTVTSFIVLLWGKKVFAGNREAIFIHGFLLAVWIFRACIAVLYPCPPETNVWMNYGQWIGTVLILLLLLIPFIKVNEKRFSR